MQSRIQKIGPNSLKWLAHKRNDYIRQHGTNFKKCHRDKKWQCSGNGRVHNPRASFLKVALSHKHGVKHTICKSKSTWNGWFSMCARERMFCVLTMKLTVYKTNGRALHTVTLKWNTTRNLPNAILFICFDIGYQHSHCHVVPTRY